MLVHQLLVVTSAHGGPSAPGGNITMSTAEVRTPQCGVPPGDIFRLHNIAIAEDQMDAEPMRSFQHILLRFKTGFSAVSPNKYSSLTPVRCFFQHDGRRFMTENGGGDLTVGWMDSPFKKIPPSRDNVMPGMWMKHYGQICPGEEMMLRDLFINVLIFVCLCVCVCT